MDKDSEKYAFAQRVVWEAMQFVDPQWKYQRIVFFSNKYTASIQNFLLRSLNFHFYKTYLPTSDHVLRTYKTALQPIISYQNTIGYIPLEVLVFSSFLGFYAARLYFRGLKEAPDYAVIAIGNALKLFDETDQFESDGWERLDNYASLIIQESDEIINGCVITSKTGERIHQCLEKYAMTTVPQAHLVQRLDPQFYLMEKPTIETPLVKIPAPEASLVKKPSPVSPLVKMPSSESPVLKVPSRETPVLKVLSRETPVLKVPSRETPVLKVPSRETPVLKVPSRETPVLKVPSHESPVLKMSSLKSPVLKMSSPESPVLNMSSPESPVVKMSSPESPVVKMSSPGSPVVNMSSPESLVVNMSSPESLVVNMSSPESPLENVSYPVSPLVKQLFPESPLVKEPLEPLAQMPAPDADLENNNNNKWVTSKLGTGQYVLWKEQQM